MARLRSWVSASLVSSAVLAAAAGCSSSSSGNGSHPEGGPDAATGAGGGAGQGAGGVSSAGAAGTSSGGGAASGGASGAGGKASSGGASGAAGGAGSGGAGTGGSPGDGWLHTKGNKIYVSKGGVDSPWVGRGVNLDDIFFCGYDNTLWMNAPEQTLQTVVSGLMSAWKPTFIRMSLSMASNQTTVSWLDNPSQYKTPMTSVIDAIGKNPNVYVLVTLRSDASMIGQDQADGDPEATGIPSDAKTTPDATKFPTGTDATYIALVDSFGSSSFVMFGLTNEPGGNKQSNQTLAAAMDHAVGVIRAEEDRLGVPHHLVSVQGNGWTSDIGFYAQTPLTEDNVVYEVHGYPPQTSSYTYANIPVIIGEYGSLDGGSAPGFFADLETKQIPSLAWDFDSYSNCAPDLVEVDQSPTTLTPTAWGKIVQGYLLAHAP